MVAIRLTLLLLLLLLPHVGPTGEAAAQVLDTRSRVPQVRGISTTALSVHTSVVPSY